MKKDCPQHPKFLELKSVLQIPKYQAVGVLETIWHLAQSFTPETGDLSRFTPRQIAASLEWTGDPDKLIDDLVDTHWLDRSDNGALIIHGWAEHRPTYLNDRFRKRALRENNPATSTDKQKTKQKRPPADPLKQLTVLSAFYPDLCDMLSEAHPKTVAIPESGSKAERAWRMVLAHTVKTDGFREKAVVDALRWIFTATHKDATFWKSVLRSVPPLRGDKRGNGSKIAQILERWEQATGNAARDTRTPEEVAAQKAKQEERRAAITLPDGRIKPMFSDDIPWDDQT